MYWYRKAAERGDPEAQYNLGYSYAIGAGVTKDLEEAARWYERAAEGGDIRSRGVLAALYATDTFEGFSPFTAYKWLLLALPQLPSYGESARAEALAFQRGLESLIDEDARARAKAAADEWAGLHPKAPG